MNGNQTNEQQKQEASGTATQGLRKTGFGGEPNGSKS